MVDSYPYSLNTNSKPSSSSITSSSESSRVAHGQSGPNSITVRSQRHSAPSSYTVYRTTHSNNSQEEDPHSRQSLFDLLQYLVVFFFTYVKFLLQRVFPFRAPFYNSFVDVSSTPEPIISEPPERETASQQYLLPPSSSRALPLRKSSLQTVSSSSNCTRACCRSSSFSGEQRNINNSQVNTNRYSSIRDLLQERNRARNRVFFPLTIFPFSLALTVYQYISLNRFLELSRISRYYKSAVQMRERFRNLFRWRPTSAEELDHAENAILSNLKCPYKTYYVDIGKGWDLENVLIWTLEVPSKPANEIAATERESPVAPQIITNPPTKGFNEQFVPAHLQGLPLVMVHGFASGVALWSLNLDELSLKGKRHVFAFDLLGFAKSSRPKWTFPKFNNNMTALQKSKAEAETMEEYMVDSIEKWRRAIGGPLAEKFVLLGHSFGGYLCTAYALRYPEHVAHVILADPWGLPADSQTRDKNSVHYTSSRQLPFWVQVMGRLMLDVFTPLAGLRAVGPWGPRIISSLRPDLKKKFAKLAGEPETPLPESGESDVDISSSSEDDSSKEGGPPPKDDIITNYIYHCNANNRPSGEIAFKKLCTHTGWARMPMIERIMELAPHITVSFIYGSRSWIDRQSGFQTKYILATAANSANALTVPSSSDSDNEKAERVNVHIMQGSGHHVYADNAEEFNQLVMNICTEVDCLLLQQAMEEQGNEFEWDEEEDDSFLQQQQVANAATNANSTNGNWLENGGTTVQSSATLNSGPTSNLTSSKLDLQKNAIPEEDSY